MVEVATPAERRFGLLLGLLLLAGLVVRIGYVLVQPEVDPTFDAPLLDGAYYLDWARSLAAGEGGPEGAYYLAPLYPLLLTVWLWTSGGSFALLYLLQHAATLATAALLALCGRRVAGATAGLAVAALVLLYRPLLFFASSPLGETVSLLLLALGLWAIGAGRRVGEDVAPATAGLASGLASLARPNLLAVSALWALREACSKRWRAALLLAAGVLLVLVPVTLRNARVSGHLVPVSGNMGITLYHGNGEGAGGVYTPPWHFGGALSSLREEATLQARLQSGRDLDAVEADRWWARQALRYRLQEPVETIRLLGRKLVLLLASEELGLDYDPGLDRNPWRWGSPLPFALILGLAVVAVTLSGLSGSGGSSVWTAVAGCALTPLVFYVSSRYRLPLAVLLCMPAGIGLSLLVGAGREIPGRRRLIALVVGLACAAASATVPTGRVGEELRAAALANRAVAWMNKGESAAAERDLRAALAYDPSRVRDASVPALYHLGILLSGRGDDREAERCYGMALAIDPTHVESAANLARLLIESGRPNEAIDPLREALRSRPDSDVGWNNLVVALAARGDLPGARAAAAEAARYGVRLDPELLRRIGERSP